MNRISWSIPSQEEAEEFSQSYLSAQEAYYESKRSEAGMTLQEIMSLNDGERKEGELDDRSST